MTTAVVMAKAPRPGHVKTRLCPPCTPEEAARLAEAALVDTFDAIDRARFSERVLALDGAAGDWLPVGWTIRPQRGLGLAERLGAAVAEIDGPVLVVGMDTPQVTPDLLDDACRRLRDPATDAVLGPAPDGGYWAIGFREAPRGAFDRVEMSTARTGDQQRARLAELGLRVHELSALRDVDSIDDARQVAALVPRSRFARALAATPGQR
jgi:uncharacterized protein